MKGDGYLERLAHCKKQIFKDSKNAQWWRVAVETYSHLLQCPFSHSGGLITCQWTGEREAASGGNGSNNDQDDQYHATTRRQS